MYTHLISVDQLQALQASGAPLLVFDCSFDLADAATAENAQSFAVHIMDGCAEVAEKRAVLP